MGVNKVDLSTGETLIDISNDTVTPETLAKGVTAHNAKGDSIVGTMTAEGGGSGVSDNEVVFVTCDLDLATLSASNLSHTYQEIKSLAESGKMIKLVGSIKGILTAYGDLVANNLVESTVAFQIMVQYNLGSGVMLYYFNMAVFSNGTIRVMPYIVNTTSMGG